MNFSIRPAEAEDVEGIGRLAQEVADYLRALGDEGELKFDAEAYLRDGFGSNPAFAGLVAQHGDDIHGYLLYHPGYDADYATRTLHIVDLYVRDEWRGRGVGRALMEQASRICRNLGGTQMCWPVYARNQMALQFYERMGARLTKDTLFMRLDV
ncbi:MAG TPA: GNAT family N-acetyltransferase [Pyrinomonadaceae bacterium]